MAGARTSVRLTLDILGVRELDQTLVVAADNARTAIRDSADDIMSVLAEHALEGFATEGASHGSPWRALSRSYAAAKERLHRKSPSRYPGTTIGVLTGRLLNSLTTGQGSGGDALRIVRDDFLIWGTRTPYAAKFSAVRPLIRLTDDAQDRIAQLVRERLVGALRQGTQRAQLAGISR